MLTSEFIARLKKCNPNFVMKFHNKDRVGMLSLYKPSHELSNPDGTYDICGIPSPAFYSGIPPYNFIDFTGRKTRGWHKIIQILVEKGVISQSKAHKYFPNWNIFGGHPIEYKENLPQIEMNSGIHPLSTSKQAIVSR